MVPKSRSNKSYLGICKDLETTEKDIKYFCSRKNKSDEYKHICEMLMTYYRYLKEVCEGVEE